MQQQRKHDSDKVTRKRHEYVDALGCKGSGDQSEYADRRRLDDDQNHAHDDIVEVAEDRSDSSAGRSRLRQREAEKQCKNDDLQHLPFGKRIDGIPREHVDEDVADRRRRLTLEVHITRKIESCAGRDESGQSQRDDERERGSDHIKTDRLDTDSAQRAKIS